MELTRDFGCLRSLSWRCDLPPGSDCDVLIGALMEKGFAQVPSPSVLRLIRSPEGHEILFVPRTGRVQIRVHYVTPEEERRFCAEQMFALIVRTILGLPGTSSRAS
jgi:hypothetical protein